MTATAGNADRTTLLALTGNLDIGDVADPALRLAYFQYMTDLSDANYQFTTGLISAGTLSRLGIINVKDYGAKGDGVTDDTTAFFNAITYCIANGIPLFVPAGIYIIASNVLYFALTAGQSFEMFGYRFQSILKRKSGSITADFHQMMRFTTSGVGNAKAVCIREIFFDSNATGNPLPDPVGNPYEWQHCADLSIAGILGATIENVDIDRVSFTDAVADHIYFGGATNCYVLSANIPGMHVSNRNRVRSDITVTGGMVNMNISDFDGTKIEVEFNSPYDGTEKMQLNISNAYVSQMLDIGGNGDTLNIECSNVNSMAHTNFTAVSGTVSNSILKHGNGYYGTGLTEYRFNYLHDLNFVESSLYAKPNETTKACIPFYFQSEPTTGFIAGFDNCRFILDTLLPDTFTGRLIETVAWAATKDTNLAVLKIRNCKFEGKMDRNIHLNRSGYVFLTNNDYNGIADAIYIRSDINNYLYPIIDGGNYRRVAGKQIHIETSGALQPTIEFKNVSLESATAAFNNTSSGYLNSVIKGNRLIYFAATPTGGACMGDIAQLTTPVSGQAYRWMAITTHPTAATWIMLDQAGIKKGTTAQRPTANAIDIGLRYLDTTLDADGKLIVWNGTAWLDATGAVV